MTSKLMFVEGAKQTPCIWSILMLCWPGTILRETPWRMLDSLSAALHVFRLEILVPQFHNYVTLYISYYLHYYIYLHLSNLKPANQNWPIFQCQTAVEIKERGDSAKWNKKKVQSLGDGAQTKLKFACLKRKPISTVFLLQAKSCKINYLWRAFHLICTSILMSYFLDNVNEKSSFNFQ